jgi:hypothetical protein
MARKRSNEILPSYGNMIADITIYCGCRKSLIFGVTTKVR